MSPGQWAIEWVDREREPAHEPNPRYPHGVDVHAARSSGPTCSTPLPYPARRCGYYLVECTRCGLVVAITTAGRADDPRSITVSCQPPARE